MKMFDFESYLHFQNTEHVAQRAHTIIAYFLTDEKTKKIINKTKK